MTKQAIGVMDSGLGGLTAVKAIMEQLPQESIIYVADTARLPYGPRSSQEVSDFVIQIGHFLESKNVKMLVIACNTATVAGLARAQQELSIPVIGMIYPGSHAAVETTSNHHYLVFATEGTVNSHAYREMIESMDSQAIVTEIACPSFVTLVEQGNWSGSLVDMAIHEAFEAVDDDQVDTLILGCTHFPILSDAIQEESPYPVSLVNPGEASVKEIYQYLDEQDKISHGLATYEFYTTGDVEGFEYFMERILPIEHASITHLKVEVLESYGD